MKKLSTGSYALLAALVGCGGKSQPAREPAPAPPAADRDKTEEPEPVAREDVDQGGGVDTSATIPDDAAGPTLTAGLRAEAEIKLLRTGASVGTIGFVESGGQVTMTAKFSGLPAGEHGMHIHEKGDCGGKQARNAGPHLNSTGARHGPPESAERHAGDLGNLVVDPDGNATFDMSTDSLTLITGPDSVNDRAIVIHAGKDDGTTQPSGNSGPPIACGVIRRLDQHQPVSVIVR